MDTLPPDIIRLIANLLDGPDYIRFSEISVNICRYLTFTGVLSRSGEPRNIRKEIISKLKGQVAMIKRRPSNIYKIKNPSFEFQLVAVKRFAYSIKYIRDPLENIKNLAIELNPCSIEYIEPQTEELVLKAIRLNPSVISKVKDPSENIKLETVKLDGFLISYFVPSSFRPFMPLPSEEVQLEAVKQNPLALEIIKSFCFMSVKLEAVKRDGCTVQFIYCPSEEYNLKQ